MPCGVYVEMDGDSTCSKVIHSQDGADHVPSKIIKDQYLPYWRAVWIVECRQSWQVTICADLIV